MKSCIVVLCLFLSCSILKAQEKDEYFYQSDSTYSHQLKIFTEYSEESLLKIEHKTRRIRVEFEFSKLCDDMIVEKEVLIEFWRQGGLFYSSTSEYNLPSNCVLLPGDSISVGLNYVLNNPWLDFKSKPFTKSSFFMIDSVINYPYQEFYTEFLRMDEDKFSALDLMDVTGYRNGVQNNDMFRREGGKFFYRSSFSGDSIIAKYRTSEGQEMSLVVKGFPSYGGRIVIGEVSRGREILKILKENHKYGEDSEFYDRPYLAIELDKLKYKAKYITLLERCGSYYSSSIEYLDKNGSVSSSYSLVGRK